jgi:hypothetical protein
MSELVCTSDVGIFGFVQTSSGFGECLKSSAPRAAIVSYVHWTASRPRRSVTRSGTVKSLTVASLARGFDLALADCARVLGEDHPLTKTVRGNLQSATG